MNKVLFSLRSAACGLLLTIAMPMALQAYPYFYRRLILEKDGKIIKIVDLISDHHGLEVPQNPTEMGPSEKSLMEVLRKIGNREDGEIVEMLCESSPEARIICQEPQNHFASNLYILPHLTVAFHDEFHPSKKKKLIFTDADTYRKADHTVRITHSLLQQNNAIDQEISLLRDLLDLETFSQMIKLYHAFVTQTLVPYNEIVAKATDMDNSILESKAYSDLKRAVTTKTMDIEIIINILKSQHRHNIICAGGAHCANVCNLLIEQFNFTLLESVGTESADLEDALNLIEELQGNQLMSSKERTAALSFIGSVAPLPTYIWDHLLEGIMSTQQEPQPRPVENNNNNNNATAQRPAIHSPRNNQLDADMALALQLQNEIGN